MNIKKYIRNIQIANQKVMDAADHLNETNEWDDNIPENEAEFVQRNAVVWDAIKNRNVVIRNWRNP